MVSDGKCVISNPVEVGEKKQVALNSLVGGFSKVFGSLGSNHYPPYN